MPVELHERLSEFSYGYGVTREVELRLQTKGLTAVPFMPSLLHEAKLGFDVGFDNDGVALMLQFKLGQAVRRFVPGPRPSLNQPFWRFKIDTAEPDGQFELLLKAELDGADVFYVAPKFHDWERYLEIFERRGVLRDSLIVKPTAIRDTLVHHGVADGEHKVVYDKANAYLCSEPVELPTLDHSDIAEKAEAHIEMRPIPLAYALEQVFAGFSERAAVRRPQERILRDDDRSAYDIPSDDDRQLRLRRERLGRLLQEGRSQEQAIALAVGAEAWSLGAQVIFVTRPSS